MKRGPTETEREAAGSAREATSPGGEPVGPGPSAAPRPLHRTRLARGAAAGLLTALAILGVGRGAALVGAATVCLAATSEPAHANPPQADREYWQTRYRDLKSKVASLRSELEQKRAEYSRGRHSRHLRGEERATLLAEIADLEKRLAAAERELKEFPEAARRAGALPGWFRDL